MHHRWRMETKTKIAGIWLQCNRQHRLHGSQLKSNYGRGKIRGHLSDQQRCEQQTRRDFASLRYIWALLLHGNLIVNRKAGKIDQHRKKKIFGEKRFAMKAVRVLQIGVMMIRSQNG
eukprot:scaffold249358_cov16-Prasinocladus_malaysianus.AAC.1